MDDRVTKLSGGGEPGRCNWCQGAMMKRSMVVLAIGAGWLLALSACDSAPPAAPRAPTSGPMATSPSTSTAPATNPAETEAGPPPAAEADPDYLVVVARYKEHERAKASARIEPGNRLVVETYNVRRLHIDREKLALDRRRSISLQLDGQGIEWTPRSSIVEFERSINGLWEPVKPNRPE
jgi:hypothetical protein